MKISCEDRERIFRDGSTEEWAALEQHALNCEVCGEEVQAWKALSTVAAELRDYSENPALWMRIEASLREQAAAPTKSKPWRGLLRSWRLSPAILQTALGGALVVALAISGIYLYVHRGSSVATPTDRLLQSSALNEVERAEQAYAKAIEKLETDAKPQLDKGDSPLIASYREKLLVLDSAIDELRLQAGQNPSNAHLRYQLLAMYQEKQETLQEILEIKR